MVGTRVLMRREICLNRDPILERLEEQARREPVNGSASLQVALAGMQGVGKTTVAVELAHRIKHHFDVCLFYRANASTPGSAVTAGQVAEFFLRRLKVPQADIPADDMERFLVLAEVLDGWRVLLVLDDVRDAPQIRPLLDVVPADAVIVTSRNFMPALNGFEPLELDVFDRPGAGRFLRQAVPRRPRLDDDLVHRLHSWSSGLPLALSMAAGRLRQPDFTTAELEILLADHPERDGGDGTRAVESMFETLDVERARQCAALALIPGTHFDPATAAAALEVDQTTARRVLRALRDANLLMAPFDDDQFTFHDTLRRFASASALTLLSENERQGLALRVIEQRWRRLVALDVTIARREPPVPVREWYERTGPAYSGPEAVRSAFDELDRDWRNLLDTAKEALKVPFARVALFFPLALWTFAFQTARHDEIVEALDAVLSVAQDPVLRWYLLRDKAASCRQDEVVDETLRQAIALNHRPGMQSLHDWYGNHLESRGEYHGALRQFELSRAAIPDMDSPEHQERAAVLLDMHSGRVLAKLGRIAEAAPLLSRAQDYFAAKPDETVNRARAGSWLGRISPDWETAFALLSGALSVFLELGMTAEAQTTCEWLADAAASADRRDDAERFRQQARELAARPSRAKPKS